jgi:hypothetical protein
MLVNDVGSYFINPYINPTQEKHGGISLGTINWVVRAAFIIALAGIVYGLLCPNAWITLAGGMVFIATGLYLYAVSAVKGLIEGQAQSSSNIKGNFSQEIIKLLIRYLAKTPIVVLKQMLVARADSVLLLNMSVFLKRIRQLLYNRFYGSPEWKYRGKGNHIYDLAYSSDIYMAKNPPPDPSLKPSPNIQKIAQTAFNMGTTLWFDKATITQQHSEACIIACGQFTTCYNLLGYVWKLPASAYDPVYAARLAGLKVQLTADYEHFKIDPFFKYNQDGIDYQIKNFEPLNVNDVPDPEF